MTRCECRIHVRVWFIYLNIFKFTLLVLVLNYCTVIIPSVADLGRFSGSHSSQVLTGCFDRSTLIRPQAGRGSRNYCWPDVNWVAKTGWTVPSAQHSKLCQYWDKLKKVFTIYLLKTGKWTYFYVQLVWQWCRKRDWFWHVLSSVLFQLLVNREPHLRYWGRDGGWVVSVQ